jgi:single-stranded DNA-binding protein
MAEIIEAPQLRYTNDNLAIAEMLVQFRALRSDDPPETLKVVGWGNRAEEIHNEFKLGDRVVLEGRLKMETREMPQGYKEKRAELTVQRVHRLDGSASQTAPAPTAARSPAPSNLVSMESRRPEPPVERSQPSRPAAPPPPAPRPAAPSFNDSDDDMDDEIPF